jgi:hypothetical protein
MIYAKSYDEAKVGELALLTTNTTRETRRRFVEIEKVTAKQIVAGGKRFWKSGSNVGSEVGQASLNWRTAYMRNSYRLSVGTKDETIVEVREEMRRREAEQRAERARAERERDAKRARRASRFEGGLVVMQKRVEELIVEDGDEITNELAKRISSMLYTHVWEIEQNEKDLRTKIARERDDLDSLIQHLDNDTNPWYSQARESIPELLEARKRLYETANGTLYLARVLLGEKKEDG